MNYSTFYWERFMRDSDSEANFVLELWETIKEAVPAAKRQELADRYVSILVDHGWDLESLDIFGEDRYLDEALRDHYGNNYDDDNSDDDDEEYSYDD